MLTAEDILKNLGYEALTPMQESMNATASSEKAVVLLSPTGSGKTLAYLFPLVRLIDKDSDKLQAVVIVPTRELAKQSEDVLKQMKTGIRALSLYGGRPTMDEHRVLREMKPQVVFATPGRLNDHLEKENIDSRYVVTLVIDEFDKCLELGFQSDMEKAIGRFASIGHCWLLSATDAESIPSFMGKLSFEAVKLDYLSETSERKDKVATYVVRSVDKDKLNTLGQLLTYIKGRQAIVFVSHRESVERVGKWLRSERFGCVWYHGGMEQDARERALYKFRSGGANILVSTDLAARGLDIEGVAAVIHYHLPLKEDEYVHRNGRTARWTAEGSIYLIVGPSEDVPPFVTASDTLNVSTITPLRPTAPLYSTIYIGRGKQEKLSKGDILGFFCKKGNIHSADIGRIDIVAHHSYAAVKREVVKTLLQHIAGEKIKGMKTLVEEMRQ